MNRYYWLALFLMIVVIASLTAIWTIDVTDQYLQQRIEFTLKIIGAVGTILAIITFFWGKSKQKIEKPFARENDEVTSYSELLSPVESISQYLLHLESMLNEYGANRKRYVELSTETEFPAFENEIKLMQSFEWAENKWTEDSFTSTRKPINFLHAHESFQRYILLGDPGSGKSTCLHYLVTELISKYRSGASELLPIFVTLSEWRDRRVSALDFLRSSFNKLAGSSNYLTKEFDNFLAQGKFLVIFDGLNEMPDRYYHEETEKEKNIESKVNILMKLSTGEPFRSMQDPRERSLRELAVSRAIRTKFIVSCRTHEFFGSPDWQEVHVLPMDINQIHQFLENYMGIDNSGELERTLEQNETLNMLAQNPFFLQSMISAFSPELNLVNNKGQFLEYLTRKLLDREKNRGLIFDVKDVIKTASKLAFRMLQKDLIGSQVELASQGQNYYLALNVLLGTGLVIKRSEGKITFYHQLIQEFFAAVALRDKYVFRSVKRLLRHKKWSEVIILWYEIGTETGLFSRLLKGLKQKIGLRMRFWGSDFIFTLLYCFLITNLLIDIIFKGSYILPILKTYPIPALITALILPLVIRTIGLNITYDGQAIANSAYILGKIANPIAIEYLIEAFARLQAGEQQTVVAKSLILFKENAIPNLLHGLLSKNQKIKKGCIEALGLLGNEEAVDPLLLILNKNEPKYFYQTVTALSRIEDPRVNPAIAKTISRSPGGCSTALSGGIGISSQFKNFKDFNPEVFDILKQSVEKGQPSSCRNIGILAIGSYGHFEGLKVLENIAMDEEESNIIRKTAINSIALLKTADAVPILINIYEKNPTLANVVAFSLGNVRYKESTDQLIPILNHPDWQMRLSAVVALGEILTPNSFSILVNKYLDENNEVRKALAKTCGRIGGTEALNILKNLCKDSENSVRVAALECMDFYFPSFAKDLFLTLAKEKSFPERELVIEYLGFYRFPEVRTTLLDLCADLNDRIKIKTVESLHRLDRNLDQELRQVLIPSQRGLKHKIILFLKRKFQIDELILLLRGNIARKNNLLFEDSEFRRRFRPWLIIFALLIIISFLFLPGIIAAVSIRLVLFLSPFLWKAKWVTLSFIIATVISFLPWVRNGKKVKFLGIVYKAIRFLGILIVVILICATLLTRWWLLVSVIVIGLIVFIVAKKFLSRYFSNVIQKNMEKTSVIGLT
jgi:HEAT repeat protein